MCPVREGSMCPVREGPMGQGAGEAVLHRQLILYEVGQSLACDVKWVEAQIVVLLLFG